MANKGTIFDNNDKTKPVDDDWLNMINAEYKNVCTGTDQVVDASQDQNLRAMAILASQAPQYCVDTGTANNYVVNPVANLTKPPVIRIGMSIRFATTNANTGSTNINAYSFGNILAKNEDGTNLSAGDIPANTLVELYYNGTNWILKKGTKATLSTQGIVLAPVQTITKYTSGSGTYTLPTNCKYIKIRMVGGGGGGAGSGNGGGAGATGGNTTFGTSLLVANGGTGGSTNGALGGSGGSASLGTGPLGTALSGGFGQAGTTTSTAGTNPCGGYGAASFFGGAGSGANGNTGGAGGSAIANTGGGGGGAGCTATGTFAGAGGGAGGFIDALISSPSATYSYSVGSSGTGGTAGTSGFIGGAGGTGYIEITEYYY